MSGRPVPSNSVPARGRPDRASASDRAAAGAGPSPLLLRRSIVAAWTVLSALSVGLSLGRSGGGLRASVALHAVAVAGGQRVFVLQNEGAEPWRHPRFWLDDRLYAEGAEVAPGMAWRITEGEFVDLHQAPLSRVDPFYAGVTTAEPPADAAHPQRAVLTDGPLRLEIPGGSIAAGAGDSPTP